jgi:multidrug efflux pump subunit AcrB
MIFLILYGGLLGLTYWRLMATPTGLIPQLDQTYLIAAFQLPPGSTLNRTDEVERGASDIMLTRPGVKDAVAFVGFDGATFTNAPNTDVTFVNLKSFEDARRKALPRTRSSRTCARR